MREYKREYESTLERVTELESKSTKLQSSLSSVEVCWNELVDILQLVIVPSGPSSSSDASKDFLTLTTNDDLKLLNATLNARSGATRDLIGSVLTASSNNNSPDADQLRRQAHLYQQEALAYKQELRLTRIQLNDCKSQWDLTKDKLLNAEKQLDRVKSNIIESVHQEGHKSSNKSSSLPPKSEPQDDLNNVNNTNDNDNKNNINEIHSPHQIQHNSNYNNNSQTQFISKEELEDARNLAMQRMTESVELRAEKVKLNQEIDKLKLSLQSLPNEFVIESNFYKDLQYQLDQSQTESDTLRQQYDQLLKDYDNLIMNRKDYEEKFKSEFNNQIEEIRLKLQQKENDINRLRGQREEFSSELNVKKSNESNKLQYIDQVQRLSESRQERINCLNSEVKRLKGQIALGYGNNECYNAIINSNDEDVNVTIALDTQLKNSNEEVKILNQSIEKIKNLNNEEIDLVKKLQLTENKLNQFESMYGNVDPKVDELINKIKVKDERIKLLELQYAEAESTSNAIYGEVERLSKAWEVLEEQNKNKIFDLQTLEDKVSRLMTEKAKADNKYFAAMRAKDGIDIERKTALRTHEKQTKTIEKLLESEKQLHLQISNMEKEIILVKNKSKTIEDKLHYIEREYNSAKLNSDDIRKKLIDTTNKLNERHSLIEEERSSKKRLEEDNMKLRNDVQRLSNLGGSTSLSSGTMNGIMNAKEENLQRERDQLFVSNNTSLKVKQYTF